MSAESQVGGRRSTLARSASAAIGSSAGVKVVALAAAVLVARLLGPEKKGLSAVLTFLATIGATAAVLGIDVWLARTLAQRVSGDAAWRVARRHLRVAMVAIGGACFVGGGLGIASGAVTPSEVAVMGFLAGGWAYYVVELGVVLGHRRMREYVVASLMGAVIYLVAALGLVLADLASVVLVVGAAGLAKWVPAVWLGHRRRRTTIADAVAVPPLHREAVRFGLPVAAGELLTMALARSDILLLALFVGPTDVGQYVTAATLTELLLLVPNAMHEVLVPHSSDPETLASSVTRALRFTLYVSLAGAVALSLVGVIAIPYVFGVAYEPAVAALPALSAAAVALALWRVLGSDLLGAGRPGARFASGVVGLVVMIAADLALIPLFGIVGAGLGSLAGYVAALLVALRTWSTLPGRSARGLFVPQAADWSQLRALVRWRGGRS